MVTDEDRAMLDYFINEKGDITRWCRWEERKPVIAAEMPELIAALDAVDAAEQMLATIMRGVY